MEDKIVITDELFILIEDQQTLTSDGIADLIKEQSDKHMHKSYTEFFVMLKSDDNKCCCNGKQSKAQLIFCGRRPETDEEYQARKAAKEREELAIKEAELKEYLRLKREFGKE